MKEEVKIIGRVRLQVLQPKTWLDAFKYRYLSNNRIGQFILKYFPAHGLVLQDTGFSNNIITTVGKALIAGLIRGSGTAATYIAVGTSTTAVAVGDTTLGAEITDSGLARVAATTSATTTSTTNDTAQYTTTWTVSGTKTVQEAGLFNAASTGTLLGHKLTGAISVVNGNVLVGTYSIQIS